MGRKPDYASSIYHGEDGYWHGRVTVGKKNNGSPDRRHVQAMTEAEVIRKVRKLERDRDAGAVRKPGPRWTVATWLTHWVEVIVAPTVRLSTLSGYRVAIRTHLIPGLGAHRLDQLEPEHLERLYLRMVKQGSAPGTAHQAHRTIRAALNEAVRRGHLVRNPALLARPPRVPDVEVEPFSVEEVKLILKQAGERRNSARWAIALALGLRQGEVLGLRWANVDLDGGALYVRRGRLRPTYEHGCVVPCGRKAGYCPDRVQTRPDTDDTKSRAGRRTVGLPAALVQLLRAHRTEQDRERVAACQLWSEGGWVFTTPTGQPIIPNTDYHHWKQLLRDAGVPDRRLHDARHTAATVLLILGVPERAVMGIMGWSSTAMAARYQHITDPIRADIARRVDGLLWQRDDGDADRASGAE